MYPKMNVGKNDTVYHKNISKKLNSGPQFPDNLPRSFTFTVNHSSESKCLFQFLNVEVLKETFNGSVKGIY